MLLFVAGDSDGVDDDDRGGSHMMLTMMAVIVQEEDVQDEEKRDCARMKQMVPRSRRMARIRTMQAG